LLGSRPPGEGPRTRRTALADARSVARGENKLASSLLIEMDGGGGDGAAAARPWTARSGAGGAGGAEAHEVPSATSRRSLFAGARGETISFELTHRRAVA
jgi:hypothetical protein